MQPRTSPLLRRLSGGPVCLVLLVLVLPLLARGSHSYLLPLAQLCGIYAIIVTGLTLLMGFTGQVSLGHAGFYGFGAYVAAVSASVFHYPVFMAILISFAATALLAFVTGFMVLRLKGHYLALATLCIGVILWEFINKTRITGGAAGLFDLPEITLFGLLRQNQAAKFYFIWFVVCLVILGAVQLTASPVGRALKAIHADETAAAALGVDVFALKLKVFVLSGVLAAVAGVLYAFVYTPSYLGPEEFGLFFSVALVTMVVIGGMGSVWGGLVGTVVMTSLHEIITLCAGRLGFTDAARFEQLVYGLLLVVMLINCPRGLVPSLARLGSRHASKAPSSCS
jgi:branched-chain amino acid transport system permease protein